MRLVQIIVVLIFVVMLVSAQVLPTEKREIVIDFQDIKLIVSDVNPGDFDTIRRGDSAVIKSRLYSAIDGKSVRIESMNAKNLTARISYEIGILQYYNDDVRASPIDFTYKTGWTPIAVSNNVIRLPQYFENYENVVNVYQHLGYPNSGAFETFLEANFFQTIKDESYPSQMRFYERVIKGRRADYEKCCLEYIGQAREFLARKPSDFTKLDDLAIEVYVPKMVLEISGANGSGNKFTCTLIGLKP